MPQPLGEPCPPASPCSGKECRSTSIKPIRWRPVTDALTIYEPSRSARLTEKGKSLSKTSKPAWPAPRPLFIDAERARLRRTDGSDLRAWDLDGRQLCLLELMLSGALTPHDRYIGAGDHAAVLEHASLADGTPCPWPLALEVTEAFANTVNVGETLALRDSEGLLVATLELEEIYAVDADAVAAALFPSGALFDAEPSAGRDWAQGQNTHRLAGRLIGIEPVFLGFLKGQFVPVIFDFFGHADDLKEFDRTVIGVELRLNFSFDAENFLGRLQDGLLKCLSKSVTLDALILRDLVDHMIKV